MVSIEIFSKDSEIMSLFQNDCVRFGHRKYALDYLATVFNAGMNAPLRDETNVRMGWHIGRDFHRQPSPTVTV